MVPLKTNVKLVLRVYSVLQRQHLKAMIVYLLWDNFWVSLFKNM